MYSASLKPEHSPNTDPTISKLLWTKEQSHPSALSIPYLRKNLQLFVSSLTRTLLQGSFVPLDPLMELRSCSLGKRMARFGFASISGLNRISKKDHYPLPLISDLLDAPRKAQVYTKIDLQHAYHLVHITAGDKWKTAFWTHYSSFEWLVIPKDRKSVV